MNKRTRLLILLAVLAVCFAFLWPSICWYWRTPKEVKALALGSLQNIKDYADAKATEEIAALKEAAKADPSAPLDESLSWFKKAAAKNYKDMGRKAPSPINTLVALDAYDSESEIHAAFQSHFRDTILSAKKRYENSVKLGLDLSGGMNIIVKADLDSVTGAAGEQTGESDDTLKKQAMEQAMENLTSRIDRFGLTSPVVRRQGEDRIYIEIPGAAQTDAINAIIMGKGVLNFRLVDESATTAFQTYYASRGAAAFNSDGALVDPSVVPSDCEVLGIYDKDEYGLDERMGYLALKKEIALEGRHIKSARVSANRIGQPEVDFTLDTEGAQIFAEVTRAHTGERLAVVSDNKIKSAPNIKDAITTGSGSISGFALEEAQNLQKVLQTAWLEVPLSVESQQVIGASLGRLAIRQGIFAIIVGLGFIILFMLVYYKGAGINACVAQVLNLYIMFAVLSAFNMTVTLSSVAGMILTIGMAVDANVIIFERIKEELRDGRARADAITAGFANAFWAIMDSNITTFIAAIFLSQLGSGSIQGFAVTLAIGVVSSVFTALFVSHLMFDFTTETLRKKTTSISWRVK